MENVILAKKKHLIPILSWEGFEDLILKMGNGESVILGEDERNFLEAIEYISVQQGEIASSNLGGFVIPARYEIAESLTNRGKEYYVHKFVKNNEPEANRILCEALKLHPAVILISQVLSGNKNIKRVNIYNLLKHHNFEMNFKEVLLNNFLEMLKIGDIISYNKNTRDVRIFWQQDIENVASHQFISPQTPYSNIKRLREIIRLLKGTVYWIDKHFDKKAFDILADCLEALKINNFVIISSDANKTQSAMNEFIRLKTELNNKGINIQWNIVTDQNILSGFHDRWICDSSTIWNIPPVNSIFKGQESEMLRTSNKPNINKLLKNSVSVT